LPLHIVCITATCNDEPEQAELRPIFI
jgi:hypothetical protein